MEQISSTKVCGGQLIKFKFESSALHCTTQVNVFLPAGKEVKKTILWLSGLTCNEDNFAQKAGAFRKANALGIAIIMPDTSPRTFLSSLFSRRLENAQSQLNKVARPFPMRKRRGISAKAPGSTLMQQKHLTALTTRCHRLLLGNY